MSFSNTILPGFDCLLRFIKFNNGVYRRSNKLLKKNTINAGAVRYFTQEVPSSHKRSPAMATFDTFENMIETRRQQAQRSFVIQVNSENSCSELYDYCNPKCPIQKMFYYSFNSNHYVLVEFTNYEGVKDLCRHNAQEQSVESPFVWFRAVKDKKFLSFTPREQIPLNVANSQPTSDQINDWLTSSESLSDEMEVLHESTKLSDFGVRLRMIVGRQVEMALSGLFPHIRALPFGSTVNSFGKEGCDLDLVLRYGSPQSESVERRLVYHSKSPGGGQQVSRGQTQRQMELLGDLLQIHVPGVVGVKRILGARVPIIKYSHEFTGIDTDISLTNLSAVYMSELLYLFGSLDPGGQRLVFAVKTWAKSVGLTSPVPGRWISNFSLTLLCIFFLQSKQRLPTLDTLIRESRKEDERHADDINCTFLRDIRHLRTNLVQNDSPADLLKGFFDFYQNFDFDHKALNLCSGEVSSKPDYSPLYIVNPLERSLNVTKNVSLDEVERFRMETRNAAWSLETKGSLKEIFGRSPHSPSNRKYVSRLVAVRDLFS